jgi:hypothetical protein
LAGQYLFQKGGDECGAEGIPGGRPVDGGESIETA